MDFFVDAFHITWKYGLYIPRIVNPEPTMNTALIIANILAAAAFISLFF